MKLSSFPNTLKNKIFFDLTFFKICSEAADFPRTIVIALMGYLFILPTVYNQDKQLYLNFLVF